MTPMQSDAEVLKALSALEDKLMAAINSGLAAVNLALAHLTDMHHNAMLEQERRNSKFADRAHVDSLSRQMADISTELRSRVRQMERLEKSDQDLEKQIDRLRDQVAKRSFTLLTGANGYLVTAIIVLSSVVLTFLLTHVVK